MIKNISEHSSNAGSAIIVLLLCAAVFIAQSLLKATIIEIFVGGVVAILIYMIWFTSDLLLNKRATRCFPWLYGVSESKVLKSLSKIESKALKNSTIYLISPDMQNDARNPATIKCVSENLSRGINYIFLTRNDGPSSKRNVEMVQQRYAHWEKGVSIVIANDLFDALPTYNILIIENDFNGELRVFVELPIFDFSIEKSKRCFWVETDTQFANRWHEKVLSILKKRTPEVNPFHQ